MTAYNLISITRTEIFRVPIVPQENNEQSIQDIVELCKTGGNREFLVKEVVLRVEHEAFKSLNGVMK